MDTYRLSYAPNIHPMLGPSDWPIDCNVDPIKPSIPKPQRGMLKSSREKALMRHSQMKVLRSLERVTIYVVKIVVKKCHNARSCSQPENSNRKKYPKRVRKPKPTTVSYNIIFFKKKKKLYEITINWFYNWMLCVFYVLGMTLGNSIYPWKQCP
jgi:hypothetical protein